MSEEKQSSLIEELDQWIEAAVFDPLAEGATEEFRQEFLPQIKAAIRDKVAQIFQQGFEAGLRGAKSAQKGGRW